VYRSGRSSSGVATADSMAGVMAEKLDADEVMGTIKVFVGQLT
jgi:hypothetical protein